jgi:hypothetical protein
MDLLQKKTTDFALGDRYLIGSNFIRGDTPNSTTLPTHAGGELPAEASIAGAENYFQALKALSWWRTKKGDKLPEVGD